MQIKIYNIPQEKQIKQNPEATNVPFDVFYLNCQTKPWQPYILMLPYK